jgi:CRISPR/Cas system-associated protein Cas10 (large subunit of type III CRISPR-Cas system)
MAYDNEYNVVDISKSATGPKKYYCNHCHRSLFLTDKETQEYLCSFCNIVYYPNNQLVKKANRFEVPEGSDPTVDRSPPIVMMDDVNKELSSTLYRKQKLTPAYEALRKQGFKFINYEER